VVGVTASLDLDPRRQVVKLGELGLDEGDVGGREVLLKPVEFGGAGDGLR
jgi:hypothetical protein